MKRRLIIGAVCLSPPGTMGGNSKITIEIARHLQHDREVHFLVPADKVKTLTDSVGDCRAIHIHLLAPFGRSEFAHPIAASRHYYREMDRELKQIGANANDDFFSCCDFHADSVPAYFLRWKYRYRWYPSAFLFVPGPIENLYRRYGFRPFAYFLAWLYARAYVFFTSMVAAGYVITNETDFVHFPRRFRGHRLYPFYGGVNVEQIPEGRVEKTRDVVFCSRLCAQKGIMGFLDIWRIVHSRLPSARFAVIGNGSAEFERSLHAKAERLGLADSIDWLGYVNNEAKYAIYRSARVMVHPTVFDNNGMVAAEALCSGLPVVMFDLEPLRRVYTIGCRKIPYGNRNAFADAIVEELQNSASAPTEAQLAQLRQRWNWPNRVRDFAAWLDGDK